MEEIYIHSKYVIYLYIQNNFSVLITKIIVNFSQDIYVLANLLTFIKTGFQKKSKCSQLLKANLVYFFNCQQFFLRLAYNCSQVIILILFLVNILSPFFLIQQFNERFEIVQNTGCIKGFFCYVLGYHLFKNQSLVSLCQASTDQTCDKDSSLIFL